MFFDLAPANELPTLAFASLIKLLSIQYVAKRRKIVFPWLRIWPLYVVTAGYLVIAVSGFYLMNSNPKTFYVIAGICVVTMGVCSDFLINRKLLLQNASY